MKSNIFQQLLLTIGFPSDAINSSHPRAVYIRQWTGSALVQAMACRLFGAKPLPKPMLAYRQMNS